MSKSLASHSLRRAIAAILFVLPVFVLLHASGTSATAPKQITYPIKINFQSGLASEHTGYLTDGGLVRAPQNGLDYGWSQDISSTAVNSNSGDSPTEAHDTLLTPHNPWNGTDATWEIALPNGSYDVRLVVGNAGNNLSHYDILAEGEQILYGRPINGMQWLETTAVVEVSDGSLTISRGPDGSYHRFNFIEIEPHTAAAPDYTDAIKINFQPQDAPSLSGYKIDSGMSYATRPNGYTYGWNINNAMYTLDHDDAASLDQSYDTVVDMQKWSWLLDDIWEIELPTGNYNVRLVAGDTTSHVGYYRLDVEGVRIIESSGWVSGQLYDRQIQVAVDDGRLTLTNGENGANNRIAFIEITPIMPSTDPEVSNPGSDFLETFASAPTPPQLWQSANWDWTVQVGNNGRNMDSTAADYDSNCTDAGSTHTINQMDESVYSCVGRLLTAVNGNSNGVGSNYGMAYLTPNRVISATQDFTISFDMSTARSNTNGDWVEVWLMPYDNHLMAPTQSWRSGGQGEPDEGIRLALNSQNRWDAFVIDNGVSSALPLFSYDAHPVLSKTELTTFHLEVIGNTMKFGLPEHNIWWVWGDAPAILQSWDEMIVSFGQHSYFPDSNCSGGCGPNTWHWDNIDITPSEPFAIIQPDKEVVVASDSDHTFNFVNTAPDDESSLRFAAIGYNIELSYDEGATWFTPTLQLQGQDINSFQYYWTPIPRDVDEVQVRGTNWWGGDWAVRDMTIWSQTYLWPASLDWQAEGADNNALLGYEVASAGDINNDGYDDILAGAPGYNNNAGRVALYYGSQNGLELAPRRVIDGNRSNSRFGFSVSGAGDVNRDGYADIIIGEPRNELGGIGRAYLYYGSASGLSETATLLTDNTASSRFGYAVASAGDSDQDGYDDVLVSAPGDSNDTGRVTLYYGGANGLDLARTPWQVSGEQAGSQFGHSIASTGDVMGYGNSGVIISAPGYDGGDVGQSGRIYLYNDTVNTTLDWTFTSNQPGEQLGFTTQVAGIGDVNNDSYADIAIGFPQATGDQAEEGELLLFYGSPNGFWCL